MTEDEIERLDKAMEAETKRYILLMTHGATVRPGDPEAGEDADGGYLDYEMNTVPVLIGGDWYVEVEEGLRGLPMRKSQYGPVSAEAIPGLIASIRESRIARLENMMQSINKGEESK